MVITILFSSIMQSVYLNDQVCFSGCFPGQPGLPGSPSVFFLH